VEIFRLIFSPTIKRPAGNFTLTEVGNFSSAIVSEPRSNSDASPPSYSPKEPSIGFWPVQNPKESKELAWRVSLTSDGKISSRQIEFPQPSCNLGISNPNDSAQMVATREMLCLQSARVEHLVNLFDFFHLFVPLVALPSRNWRPATLLGF